MKLLKIRSLGPGLLYAGAAIGVSHLIQSTRAGAEYGWLPVLAIVFIHLAKYPFFRIGPLYATSTGENLVDGYRRLGKWALYSFAFFTIGTMFAIIAAIAAVNAGIAAYIFGIQLESSLVSGIVLLLCAIILILGDYRLLDRFVNFVILLLSISTILAFLLALSSADSPSLPAELLSGAFFIILIKLMGWMPAPLDLSVWHSIWAIERSKDGSYSSRESLFDFNVGYWGTMIIGAFFLGLGAMVLYPTDDLPTSGVAFSNQFIGIYTSKLGSWTFGIVAFAALTTMFSTALTCIDAIPRSLAEIFKSQKYNSNRLYKPALITLALGSFSLLYFWAPGMLVMVDFATTLSFVATPALAILNFLCWQKVNSEKSFFNYWYPLISIFLLILLTFIFLYIVL